MLSFITYGLLGNSDSSCIPGELWSTSMLSPGSQHSPWPGIQAWSQAEGSHLLSALRSRPGVLCWARMQGMERKCCFQPTPQEVSPSSSSTSPSPSPRASHRGRKFWFSLDFLHLPTVAAITIFPKESEDAIPKVVYSPPLGPGIPVQHTRNKSRWSTLTGKSLDSLSFGVSFLKMVKIITETPGL